MIGVVVNEQVVAGIDDVTIVGDEVDEKVVIFFVPHQNPICILVVCEHEFSTGGSLTDVFQYGVVFWIDTEENKLYKITQ